MVVLMIVMMMMMIVMIEDVYSDKDYDDGGDKYGCISGRGVGCGGM